jgi:hypothetical protein
VGETLHVVNCMQIFQTWRRAPKLESPRNSQLTIYLVRRPHDVIDCNCGGHSEFRRQELLKQCSSTSFPLSRSKTFRCGGLHEAPSIYGAADAGRWLNLVASHGRDHPTDQPAPR